MVWLNHGSDVRPARPPVDPLSGRAPVPSVRDRVRGGSKGGRGTGHCAPPLPPNYVGAKVCTVCNFLFLVRITCDCAPSHVTSLDPSCAALPKRKAGRHHAAGIAREPCRFTVRCCQAAVSSRSPLPSPRSLSVQAPATAGCWLLAAARGQGVAAASHADD